MSKHWNVMFYAYETQRALKKGKFTVNDVLDHLKTDDIEVRKCVSSVLNQGTKRHPEHISVIDTAMSTTSNRTVNVFKITPAGVDAIKAQKDDGRIGTMDEAIQMMQITNQHHGEKTKSGIAKSKGRLVVPPQQQNFAPPPPVIDNMSDIAESLVNSTSKLLHQNKYYRDLLLDVCMKLAGALDMKVVDKNFQPPTFLIEQNGDLFKEGE